MNKINNRLSPVHEPRLQVAELEALEDAIHQESPFMKSGCFLHIDLDESGQAVKNNAPEVQFKVTNKLKEDDKKIIVSLKFKETNDLSVERFAKQIEPLIELIESHDTLGEMKSRSERSVEMMDALEDIIRDNTNIVGSSIRFGA